MHVEHTPALPPSVASGFVARGRGARPTRTEASDDASPPGLNGRPLGPLPLGSPPLAEDHLPLTLEASPAEGTGAALDDDGRCVGALRAQLRASATRSASDLEVRVDPWNQGAALASLGSGSGSSASSSRRPSNEPRRPSCCSCASDALSDATLPGHLIIPTSEAASLGSGSLTPACHAIGTEVGLQEIHSVLHGVLLELRELKAAQRGDH